MWRKYSLTHTCAVPATNLNAIAAPVGDGGGLLSDDMLSALESPQFHMMQDECFLSLHAMSGQPQHRTIQLRALVKNQALIILVDSRSSHTFLNSTVAGRLQAPITPILALSVKVVNGALLSCSGEVHNFQWWIQGFTFQVNAKVLDMGAYDLVWGMDWLEQFSPMLCDWLGKWIEFPYEGNTIRLQGILHTTTLELQKISVEQIVKWDKGNDLWVAILVEPATK
jgi:hypothetical protein